ncbi:MAG: hypothetical protein NTX29_05085, partial [Actinobacteria bacterium]|nr:hypothetical protein [Actinomycetota bacterium]
MTAQIAVGTGLVLISWAVSLAVLGLLGLAPAVLVAGRRWSVTTVRASLWWGLAIAAVSVMVINQWFPLPVAGILLAMRARKAGGYRLHLVFRRWPVIVIAVLAIATVYMAVAALGPVTNYDSGLYHLGAIRYDGDYVTVPGLANLYFPFGYANSEFPMAAFLGNGPWSGEGFRLLNGLIMVAGGVDLTLRLLSRRLSTGTFVLMMGVAVAWLPMVALSDYWVTSPTSDSAVFLLTIVAVAYLADALSGRRHWVPDAAVAIVITFVLVSLRPMMVLFALPLVIVVLGWGRHVRRTRIAAAHGRVTVGLVLGLGILGAMAITARDYVLSGWLQFPLSILPFSVEWRAPDPTWARTATLGAARDPADLWNAAENWQWIGVWIAALRHQWETYAVIALAVATIVVLLVARQHGLRVKALLLVMTPSAIAVVVWWIATPPSFRFIWGPLFTLAAIPLGWAGARLYRSRRPGVVVGNRALGLWSLAVVLAILPVVVFSALFRLQVGAMTDNREMAIGPLSLGYAVAPVPVAETREQTLGSGLTVLFPVQSDQCWNAYPLCTAQLDGAVGLRGSTLQ